MDLQGWEQAGKRRGAGRLSPEQRELAARHVGLVGLHLRMRVRTLRPPRVDRDRNDLFQEGCLALVRAAARYDAQRHGCFAAYALVRIRGAIHRALCDRSSLIRLPIRAARVAYKSPREAGLRLLVAGASDLAAPATKQAEHDGYYESIRHLIRRRFERAVRLAVAWLRVHSSRRRRPAGVVERIAKERLLVDRADHRSSLRRIARELGVGAKAVLAAERRLVDAVSARFEADAQLLDLLRFAREDSHALDGVVGRHRLAVLRDAEMRAFRRRFAALAGPARKEVLYAIVERATASVEETAANLCRLILSKDAELPDAVDEPADGIVAVNDWAAGGGGVSRNGLRAASGSALIIRDFVPVIDRPHAPSTDVHESRVGLMG